MTRKEIKAVLVSAQLRLNRDIHNESLSRIRERRTYAKSYKLIQRRQRVNWKSCMSRIISHVVVQNRVHRVELFRRRPERPNNKIQCHQADEKDQAQYVFASIGAVNAHQGLPAKRLLDLDVDQAPGRRFIH